MRKIDVMLATQYYTSDGILEVRGTADFANQLAEVDSSLYRVDSPDTAIVPASCLPSNSI